MANSNSTDFLRFSAYSIRDAIIRKLSESSEFTDQIYEGSNLNILIDLVSYMYQCLVFQLNSAASESMFADTQIFENIVRLVSLLGYQAKGCTPSALQAYVTYTGDEETASLLPYTRFDTGLTDSNGKRIYFSTAKLNSTDNQAEIPVSKETASKVTFYNGQYKMYSTVFTASGLGNETFVLTGLKSNASADKYVAYNFIDVYVEDSKGNLTYWNYDSNGIFLKSRNLQDLAPESSLYGGSDSTEDKVYTVSLNEDKEYELHFGDGIVGKKLNAGDRVVIMYLDTNGPDGKVDIQDIDFGALKLEHSPSMFSMNSSLYARMFESADKSIANGSSYTIQSNAVAVSEFAAEESVDEIKLNAPNWFKTGNRLITKSDYEYFIKNNQNLRMNVFTGQPIADVKCMNNTEYVATFYKWLYIQGRDNNLENGGRHYFDQTFWNKNDYPFVDPADSNNTYLWIKTRNSEISERQDEYDAGYLGDELDKQLTPIKTMTTEIKVVKPVYVNFDICARPIGTEEELEDFKNDYFDPGTTYFDQNIDSYIEVTLDDNTLYVSTSIQDSIYNIILNEFNINTCRFGKVINYDIMLNKIYNIAGVRNVRTVYVKDGKLIRSYDGLSFATWSPILTDDENREGVDLTVGNSIRALEPFQFPMFIGKQLLSKRIKLIKKSMTAINTLKM